MTAIKIFLSKLWRMYLVVKARLVAPRVLAMFMKMDNKGHFEMSSILFLLCLGKFLHWNNIFVLIEINLTLVQSALSIVLSAVFKLCYSLRQLMLS
jgi:hypothetical protein